LIALIINTRYRHQSSILIPDFRILILKDQLASDRSDGVRSSSRQMHGRSALKPCSSALGDCVSIAIRAAARHAIDSRSDPTSSRCQIPRARAEPTGSTASVELFFP